MELISKEEAMQLLTEDYYASRSREEDERAEVCLLHLIDISNLPTIEERKEGRWIRDGHHIICSECSEYICDTDREGDTIPQNFCPNCGARMKGE